MVGEGFVSQPDERPGPRQPAAEPAPRQRGEAPEPSRPGEAPVGPEIAPGVRELDHTADLGIVVTAPDPAELFRRAALGMARLMREASPAEREAEPSAEQLVERAERLVERAADSLDLLLVSWLGELLYLDEAEGFVFEDAVFHELAAGGFRATVTGRIEPDIPERQLKGVTYHGLRLEASGGEWRARVIFDI